MPYLPAGKKYRVFLGGLPGRSKNGDYDTVGYLIFFTPDDKKVELNRYF